MTTIKFKLDACYKTTLSADSTFARTYTMQVYNRTACYIQANVFGKVESYKVSVDANGVEYINATRHVGRRALIFKADSEFPLDDSPIFATESDIANQKIIDATDEIVTADAVDASVEALTAENAVKENAEKVKIDKAIAMLYEKANDESNAFRDCLVFEMTAELIRQMKENDEIEKKLIAEGQVAPDLFAEQRAEGTEPAIASIKFDDYNLSNLKAKTARDIIYIAGLQESEYHFENNFRYEISNYWSVNRSGVVKAVETALGMKLDYNVDDNAVNAVIANQKLIEVMDEIITADAVDASVEVMEKINSEKDSAMPNAYHMLAINTKGSLTFDGKRISKPAAAEEVTCAYNCAKSTVRKNYKDIGAVLIMDKNVQDYIRAYASKWCCVSHLQPQTVRVVDFAVDELPYINQKTESIVAYYKAEAKKEAERKEKERAYQASPERQLDELDTYIARLEADIHGQQRRIRLTAESIIHLLRQIDYEEDFIYKCGLEIDNVRVQIDSAQKAKKIFLDEIATRAAFRTINALAVDIEDDGSNDDPAEDEDEIITVDITTEDDDDDELVDDSIIEVVENKDVHTAEPKKFEVGKIYPLHDICYKVIRRTVMTVTFVHETACSKVVGLNHEKVTRKAVEYDDNGNEVVYGFSVLGRLEAAVDLHTYEVRFKCKLVEGNEFVSYDWTDVVDVDAEEVTATVHAEPITFNLQNFSSIEPAHAEKKVATIDTSTTNALIPPNNIINADAEFGTIDFDANKKSYIAQWNEYEEKIEKINQQMKLLESERDALMNEQHEIFLTANKTLETLKRWTHNSLVNALKGDKKIKLIKPNGTTIMLSADNTLSICGEFPAGNIVAYLNYRPALACDSAKKFKSEIRKLVTAIERGDKDFVIKE